MAGYQVNGMPLMMHELADERVQWFQQNGNRQQRLEAAEILRERQARAQAWEAYRQTPGYLADRELARPFPKSEKNLGVLADPQPIPRLDPQPIPRLETPRFLPPEELFQKEMPRFLPPEELLQ